VIVRRGQGLALLGVLIVVGGCSELRETLHPNRVDVAPAGYGQAMVFDGHELWVAYDCGGARVDVHYIGAYADASLPDGTVRRMARTGGGASLGYSGSGVTLNGPGLSPNWSGADSQAVSCRVLAV
jgi:hypothetical protein